MRIASHLKRTEDEAQNTISSSGYVDWLVFLEYLETESNHTRLEYFLANIARAMFQVNAKAGKEVPLDPFLLKLKAEYKESTNVNLSEEEKQKRLQNSKNFWGAITSRPKTKDRVRRKTPPKQSPMPSKKKR